MPYTDSADDNNQTIEDDYGISDYVQQQRAQQAAKAAADQERASAQRASDIDSDDPLMQGLVQRYRPADRPADRVDAAALDEPAAPDSSMGGLLSKAAEKLYRGVDTDIREQQAKQAAVIPGVWGSIKQKLSDYINGTNAAPPQEVDAALAATQAANPGASTADVVQKTVAGTADPLSPNYMDQAGRDALGGLGSRGAAASAGGTSTGYAQQGAQAADQARARGENTLYDTPANMAIGRPLYDVDDIQRGTPLNMPQPSSRAAPARAAPRTYIGPQGEERTGPNRAVLPGPGKGRSNRRSDAGDDTGAPGPQYAMADTGTMSDASNDIRSNAGQSDIIRTGPTVDFLGNPIPSGSAREFGPYLADQSRVSPDSIRVGPQQQATGYARSTYTGSQGEERTGPNTLVAQGTPVDNPVMQERLADLQQRIQAQTGLSNTEAARLAYDTAERDPSQLTPRYENPPTRRPAASQSTGYANQPPSAAGFSGAVGNNVTTIPVRQGAFTPAGAAPAPAGAVPAPRGPTNEDFTRDVAEGRAGMKNAGTPYTPRTDAGGGTANPTYPQGYKLVPAAPAQGTVSDYDRAVVGPDGKVVSYVRKGDNPPSSDVMMNKVYSDNYNKNREDFFQRLRAGEPTGIGLGRGYDFSKPLPARQAPTAQSMADRDEAVRQNIIHAPAQGAGGDPVQDLLQRASQTRDVNAQRMFTNEAYKIQEARRVNQQKSADATLKTFSTGEQNLIKSIYTKENAGNQLTPAEQALKDDYVTRIQQHSRSQQGGGQAAARAPTAQSTGAPVRVSSPAQARSLPSGTRIILPDGSPGIVP
jgi:hypothetical protein